jgi:hypothetical protein
VPVGAGALNWWTGWFGATWCVVPLVAIGTAVGAVVGVVVGVDVGAWVGA